MALIPDKKGPYVRHPFFLTFRNRAEETEYRVSTVTQSVVRTRIAMALGILMNVFFHTLDVHLSLPGAAYTAPVRFGFIVPVLVLGLALSWWRPFKNHIQFFAILILACHALGNTGMSIAMNMNGLVMPDGYTLLAAIILTIFAYTFAVLRLSNALIAGMIILGLYEILSIAVMKVPAHIMEMNNFYLISANILGLGASWTVENHARNEYVQSILIEQERESLRKRNRLIETELEMARRIQESLIPRKSPHPTISFFYKPMDKLGGDFIDLIPLGPDGRTGVFISDVSGHGVPAAFITAMIKSTIQRAGPLLTDPAGLLRLLNESLFHQTSGNFVTSLYGIYDPGSKSFLFSGAGHLGPLKITKDRILDVERSHQGVPLAVMSNEEMDRYGRPYKNLKVDCGPGDKLFLFTDGLTEAISSRQRLVRGIAPDFESTGLIPAIEAARHLSSIPFIRAIADSLENFRGSPHFEDDVCMICLEA